MQAKLLNTWENIRASLWFVPTLMVMLAVVLSSILIEVDGVLATNRNPLVAWFFGGTAGAAQAILATVAGSLITVISIAFSITILALQLASSQFTPRVLRTSFTSDRGSQIVLLELAICLPPGPRGRAVQHEVARLATFSTLAGSALPTLPHSAAKPTM